MGFFSIRKIPDESSYTQEDRTVVQVIRSRLKGKPKEASHVLRPSPSSSHTRNANGHLGPCNDDSLADSNGRKPLPNVATRSTLRSQLTNGQRNDTTAPPRSSTDAISITLAQRLNELATANSEGLLNDDEYRLLRQNLFERFATGTGIPVETPVVPVVKHPRHNKADPTTRLSTPLPSNFYIKAPATPSIRSRNSVGSGMTGLFRRATGRNSGDSTEKDTGDTASVFSMSSTVSQALKKRPSLSLPRTMKRKESKSSLRTHTDTLSVASPRSPAGRSGIAEHNFTSTISLSRSTRRMPTSPPSSFPGIKTMLATPTGSSFFDTEHLTTTTEIRKEIESVEGEKKRLLDAFNGLEMSTLTKKQARRFPNSSKGHDAVESTWTLVPERKSSRKGPDSDTTSIRSNTSTGTAPSLARSAYSARKGTIPRTPSKSDLSPGKNGVPPLPSLGLQLSHASLSRSSVNLTRSNTHLPLASVGASSDVVRHDEEDLESEMADIVKKKAEVESRYEGRLEYLRAKLKGAELHEKLLRK